MKKNHKYEAWRHHALKKTFLVMRIVIVISLVCIMQSFALDSFTQNSKISLSVKEMKLEDILMRIEDQTIYRFAYNKTEIDVDKSYSVDINNVEIKELLDKLFLNGVVHYSIIDRQIVLSSSKESSISQQPKSISGKVTDSSRSSLPGVSVVVKGTTTGVITDMNGDYSLPKVPENATLLFSFVGMKTQEIPVAGKTTINIILIEETIGIEEVVAVGYGTQKKTNLTGAVTAISGNDIALRQVNQTSMVLQGIAPGVTITQRNGQPGVDSGTIRIRGVGTLNDSNPLVLVDGVVMSMDNIDPGTIESISVLKDAASSSIYGSRAANGVILITTKRGKEGTFSLSYNSYIGIQKPNFLPHKVGAIDHMTLLNEAYTNTGRSALFSDDYIKTYKENMVTNPDLYPDTDWQKVCLTGSGLQTNHFLGLSGGTESLKVSAQFGYTDQKGIIENVDFKRYFFRINSDIKISKKISGSFDLYVSDQERKSTAEFPASNPGAISPESNTGIIFGMMNKLPAIQADKFSNGLYGEGQNGVNPLAIMKEGGFLPYYRVTDNR